MFEMFLCWAALLVVLGMVIAAPLPGRVLAFGLVALVITVWLLWALYGVEYLADLKWPQQGSGPKGSIAELKSIGGGERIDSAEGATARLGQVGDLFGGVNALFAALAFAGVGIAAVQQWKSTQLAFKQAIEATFFSALGLHHKIVDGLQFDRVQIFPAEHDELVKSMRNAGMSPLERDSPVSGRKVFSEVIRGISYEGQTKSTYQSLRAKYEILQNKHNYVLGHYFRNLYQILKLIDLDEALDGEGKQKYASMLRAQLSSDELALLMVNCADTMVDGGGFRVLLVRYRMLEHAPLKMIGQEYLHSGNTRHVVLADKVAITQYLSEPATTSRRHTYQGAFGSNPAI